MRVAGALVARARVRGTAGEGGPGRLADVDHVERAAARLAAAIGADRVGEARLLVDRDVVRARDPVVVRRLGEHDRIALHVAQLREVEHLHAVRTGAVGHDVGVVPVDLDVAPEVGVGALVHRQVAEHARIGGIGDVHEGGAVGAADERVLAVGLRIGPAPDVVQVDAAPGAEGAERKVGEQVHPLAVEVRHLARVALLLATDHLRVLGRLVHHLRLHGPLARRRRARECDDGAHAARAERSGGDRHVPVRREPGTEQPGTRAAVGIDDLPLRPAIRAAVEHVDAARLLVDGGRADQQVVARPRHRRAELAHGHHRVGLQLDHLLPDGTAAPVAVDDARGLRGAGRAHECLVAVEQHRRAEAARGVGADAQRRLRLPRAVGLHRVHHRRAVLDAQVGVGAVLLAAAAKEARRPHHDPPARERQRLAQAVAHLGAAGHARQRRPRSGSCIEP